ncbi:MAG: SDR family NAD(P)-dependent oxidoreductase [Lachnospiraceae bacterium]|nr:SDR family NAD(P)-dependent oxidoreductase [Lachnospiraceae bacterium]
MEKTALITGASRGIGKAIAGKLASEGYNLVLTCINSFMELQYYAKQLEIAYHIHCTAVQCDAASWTEVKELTKVLPPLDVLVNNAGISQIGLLTDLSPEEWSRIIDTNLSSVFYTCRNIVPQMVANHSGRILNITSVWGEHGASMEVAYSASKGGINAFTKALAKELAPSGIAVNALSCGYIDTDMNRHFDDSEVEAVIAEIPADRIGTPNEVAQMAECILKMPLYTTGQIFTIDGGWMV